MGNDTENVGMAKDNVDDVVEAGNDEYTDEDIIDIVDMAFVLPDDGEIEVAKVGGNMVSTVLELISSVLGPLEVLAKRAERDLAGDFVGMSERLLMVVAFLDANEVLLITVHDAEEPSCVF